MYILDLKKGKAVRYLAPSPQIAFDDPVMTQDGKYLFTRGGLENMFRFQNVNGKFRAEEASPRIAQGAVAAGIQVSPDSKLVCLPCGGGNYGARPSYSTFVYDMKTFKKAEFTLEQGAYPQAVGFDPAGGYIYAQNHDHPLIVYSYTGIKKKEYKLGRDAVSVRQYLPHPEGNKLLMLTADKIFSIEVPPKKK
jgi:DNA-binding beta-propeller fold protein YncE